MDKNKLLQVSQIVSHDACPDGTGAAMICTAAYVAAGITPPGSYFVKYDTRSHDDLIAKQNQLFVDITPSKKRWTEWKDKSPIVLDHHETVEYIVNELGGVYGGTTRSGAMLAFDEVMLTLSDKHLDEWKHFAHLCAVRDLWQTNSSDWPQACALAHALLLYGRDWCIEAATTGKVSIPELLVIGGKVYDKMIRQSKAVIKNSDALELCLNGKILKIVFFNHGEGSVSDIANYVIDNYPCDAVFGYFYTYEYGEIKCVVSIRTNGSISASKLANSFGGGGHARAAGFRLNEDISPKKIVEKVVERIITASDLI